VGAGVSAEDQRSAGTSSTTGSGRRNFALADALCWLVASRCRFWTCWSWRRAAGTTQSPPRGLPGPCSSSATWPMCRRRARRARSRASVPSWSSATTAPGMDEEGASTASRRRSWMSWRRRCRESRPSPSTWWGQTEVIRRRPGHARDVRSRRVPAHAEQAMHCLSGSRLAKDRAADTVSSVMIPKPWTIRMSGEAIAADATAPESAAAPDIDRATMEVDIAAVGFGPAMGGISDHADARVDCASRRSCVCQPVAPECATGSLLRASGRYCRRSQRNRHSARGIRASFPELNPAEIPMATPVSEERVMYLLDRLEPAGGRLR